MTSEKIEKLKQAIFMSGTDACDDFCGISTENMDKDAVDNLMDEIIDQMPEEEFEKFYEKYVVTTDSEDFLSVYSMNDLITAYIAVNPSDCDAVLEYMSELTGKSVDALHEKIKAL